VPADERRGTAGRHGRDPLPRYYLLSDAGITVEVISYSHPTYQQGRSLFTPGLSTLDALLYCGPGASKLLATGTSIQPWPQS
jgi:hypothetical protein